MLIIRQNRGGSWKDFVFSFPSVCWKDLAKSSRGKKLVWPEFGEQIRLDLGKNPYVTFHSHFQTFLLNLKKSVFTYGWSQVRELALQASRIKEIQEKKNFRLLTQHDFILGVQKLNFP